MQILDAFLFADLNGALNQGVLNRFIAMRQFGNDMDRAQNTISVEELCKSQKFISMVCADEIRSIDEGLQVHVDGGCIVTIVVELPSLSDGRLVVDGFDPHGKLLIQCCNADINAAFNSFANFVSYPEVKIVPPVSMIGYRKNSSARWFFVERVNGLVIGDVLNKRQQVRGRRTTLKYPYGI
ncbi:MAG TPA: hypothetical protein VFX07_00230 [Candidatus Udaeobacter sp.]|nr:hypothetical protein [Candidatus Udaeobacter sp.]